MRHVLRRFVLGAACAASLALCSCTDPFPQKDGMLHIVAVGLDYRNASAGFRLEEGGSVVTVDPLSGVTADVTELGECLRVQCAGRGYVADVTYLLAYGNDASSAQEHYPTRERILSALASLDPGPEDMVLLVCSGHGGYDEDADEAFLVAGINPDSGVYEPLHVSEVAEAMGRLGCPSAVIGDFCYSGSLGTHGALETEVRGILGSAASYLQTAYACSCGEAEVSYEVELPCGETHGLGVAGILDGLGWVHQDSVFSVVAQDGYEIVVHGGLDNTPTKAGAVLFGDVAEDAGRYIRSVTASWPATRRTHPFIYHGESEVALLPPGK